MYHEPTQYEDYEHNYECEDCNKHQKNLNNGAIYLKKIWEILCDTDKLDDEELGRAVEELACVLDCENDKDFDIMKNITITRDKQDHDYLNEAVCLTKLYTKQILTEVCQ